MPSVKDFLIDILVGCSCQDVREKACTQLTELTSLRTNVIPHPSHFLTQVNFLKS